MRRWNSILLATTTAALIAGPARAEPLFYSGFENGFPGEFTDYDDGTLTDEDVPNNGKNEAWSIVGEDKFPEILAGEKVYKGWITGPQGSSHRAYPVLHTDLPTPLVNSFWVWLDVDYDKLDPQTDWVHVGTWGNNPEWTVHTMSVLDKKLHMAHLDGYKYIGPMPQEPFPLRKWVRITVYLYYPEVGDGLVCAWQDGVPVMTGKWTKADGPNLQRTHWGMYAAGSVDHGVQYNDEIQIWSLDEQLPGCDVAEPVSPYPQPGDTGDESSGSSGDSDSSGAVDTTTGDDTTSGDGTTAVEGTTLADPTTSGDATTGAGETASEQPTTGSAGETTANATTSGAGTTGDGDTAGMSDDSGCGCTSDGSNTGLGLLGLGLLAALRRRRR